MANEEHLARLKQGVEAWNRWREKYPEIHSDLTNADLSGADLSGADLSWSNLIETNLSQADLIETNLSQADLSEARLSQADLSGADLSRADLRGADLSAATLSQANLSQADLSQALMLQTVLNDLDLRQVKGLEIVRHLGPSDIGIQTIYRSQGEIPEVFLRGVGVPENFLEYMHSLMGKPIEYYSCFISYSSKDQAFAERLYADLQSKGVRCWYAPHDMKVGASIRPTIDESIRLHDKLLLVLSRASVASQWVEQEVERALARERKEQREVLFPVRLDQAVMESEDGWPGLVRNTRNIGDFTRWKTHDRYTKAFERLLRDLKAAS